MRHSTLVFQLSNERGRSSNLSTRARFNGVANTKTSAQRAPVRGAPLDLTLGGSKVTKSHMFHGKLTATRQKEIC